MMLRMPVFAPSVLTLQAVTVVLSEVNSVCNTHCRVQICPADATSTYSCRTTLNGVTLLACGKLDGYIDGLLHVLGTKYRSCVAAFSSDL